jgi:hypothetical protein
MKINLELSLFLSLFSYGKPSVSILKEIESPFYTVMVENKSFLPTNKHSTRQFSTQKHYRVKTPNHTKFIHPTRWNPSPFSITTYPTQPTTAATTTGVATNGPVGGVGVDLVWRWVTAQPTVSDARTERLARRPPPGSSQPQTLGVAVRPPHGPGVAARPPPSGRGWLRRAWGGHRAVELPISGHQGAFCPEYRGSSGP